MHHVSVRICVPYLLLVGTVSLLLAQVSPDPALRHSLSDAVFLTLIIALPHILFWRFGLQPLFRSLLQIIPFAPSRIAGMRTVMNGQPRIVEQTLSVIPQPTMFGVVAMAMSSTGFHSFVWDMVEGGMVGLMLLNLFWNAFHVESQV